MNHKRAIQVVDEESSQISVLIIPYTMRLLNKIKQLSLFYYVIKVIKTGSHKA